MNVICPSTVATDSTGSMFEANPGMREFVVVDGAITVGPLGFDLKEKLAKVGQNSGPTS